MAIKKNKEKPLGLIVQAAKLKKHYPKSRIITKPDQLMWKWNLSPSFWSDSYDIKILYKIGCHPDVFVINTKLQRYPGKNYLPHVYDTSEQRLCLYYKKAREWKSDMFITDTIIPWTSEWLYHYEIWAGTGKWCGKGIHGSLKPLQSEKKKSLD